MPSSAEWNDDVDESRWSWSFVAVMCLIAVIGLGIAIGSRSLTRESLLHLVGGQSSNEVEVIHAFEEFWFFMQWQYRDNGIEIPGKLSDVFHPQKFREYEEDEDTVRAHYLKSLREGIDPWETPYTYQAIMNSEGGYEIIIRSAGANRRDEKGKGDDIQSTFLMTIR